MCMDMEAISVRKIHAIPFSFFLKKKMLITDILKPLAAVVEVKHSQCVTNIEDSQAFPSRSNVGRLRFDQQLVK